VAAVDGELAEPFALRAESVDPVTHAGACPGTLCWLRNRKYRLPATTMNRSIG
jgi:hypothetical protein